MVISVKCLYVEQQSNAQYECGGGNLTIVTRRLDQLRRDRKNNAYSRATNNLMPGRRRNISRFRGATIGRGNSAVDFIAIPHFEINNF